MFITVSSDRKLDPTDAEFVDVIHTDVLGRGMLRAMGHVDFYPNIGPHQPGCQEANMEGESFKLFKCLNKKFEFDFVKMFSKHLSKNLKQPLNNFSIAREKGFFKIIGQQNNF